MKTTRRKRAALLAPVLAAGMLLSQGGMPAAAADIAVLVGEDFTSYDLVLQGFKAAVSGSVREYRMSGDVRSGERAARTIAGDRDIKLIFAIGSNAAQVARAHARDVPLVYSMVVDPEDDGIVDANSCGILLQVSPREQLELIRRVNPDFKNVGVIYSTARNRRYMEDVIPVARDMGLNVIARPVRSLGEFSRALNEMENQIDVFWMMVDSLIANREVFERLLGISLTKRIALMVPADAFVRNGGLMAVDVDYSGIGRQAAGISDRIVSGAASPGAVGQVYPETLRVVLNRRIAERLGFDIPDAVLSQAAAVY